MPNEQELLARIRELERQNSDLQDKLDMIYSIVAPDFDEPLENDTDDGSLVQIEGIAPKKPN